MGKLRDFKDSCNEILWITKNTLSTFWFWFPIIYMGYVLLQLWMMVFISPLTLAIVPVALILYGVRLESQRTKRRYSLDKTKRLSSSRALGGSPEPIGEFEWKVEKAVEQYERLMKRDNNEDD